MRSRMSSKHLQRAYFFLIHHVLHSQEYASKESTKQILEFFWTNTLIPISMRISDLRDSPLPILCNFDKQLSNN